MALNATTGAKLWERFTVPSGYSGGAVWGGNPVVDTARGTVFVGTGNNYSVPTDPAFVSCLAAPGATRASCESPDNHADSILALDMYSGAVKWAVRLENWNQQSLGVADGSDFWNVDCFVTFTNCPASAGPDYDFGSAPNEITYQTGTTTKTIIGAGQKSGIYYALDPDTGALLWETQVGPGSSLGGMEWGSASDGTRIYVEIANLYGIPYSAFGLPASLGSAGSWAALDPATGKILWQVADPNGAVDLGPLAVASGVVTRGLHGGTLAFRSGYGADRPCLPWMRPTAARSGVMRRAHPSNRKRHAIVGENVFWGSGYTRTSEYRATRATTSSTPSRSSGGRTFQRSVASARPRIRKYRAFRFCLETRCS